MSLRRFLSVLLVAAVAFCVPSVLSAQSQDFPKAEVFGGYSWYHPGASFQGVDIEDFNKGWGGQFTYNLNHWAGLALDAGGHYQDEGKVHTVTAGPQFKLRREHFTPFAEALFGVALISPNAAPDTNSFAVIAGGGLDYKVTPRFSIRPIQADYVYTTYSEPGISVTGNGIRLQAGVVFAFGLPKEEAAVSASCSADPAAVDAGAPVTISVTPSGFLPKRILSYSYTSTGGKISGNTATASLDSTGLAAGSYTVSAKVVDNGTGKHQRSASCQTSFSVNAVRPPILAVTADPDSLNSGDPSTITANGSSPDNRPLTYSCTSTAGSLSGNGPRYTLDTAGVPESTITVNCTVTDDRNLSASASAAVKVNVPVMAAAAAVPQASEFGSTECTRDLRRPARVCNEAKGELDRYADALAAAPDAKGVVVGDATAKENKRKPGLAAERAVNTKDYLVKEKGIDPARIETRTGSGDDQKVDLWIVPAVATFPEAGTTAVDESSVKAVPR
jgi:hypothetical protein